MQHSTVSLKAATKSEKPELAQLRYDYQRELLPYNRHTEEEIKTL